MMQTLGIQTATGTETTAAAPGSRPTLFYHSRPGQPLTGADVAAALVCLVVVMLPVSFYGYFLFELAALGH